MVQCVKWLILQGKPALAPDHDPCFVLSENIQSDKPEVSQESLLMRSMNSRFWLALITCVILVTGSVWAQENSADNDKKDASAQQEQDPLKRPLTDKQKKEQAKKLKQE